jgi:uncharacterized membrane protein YsdA (DUF1294 family)
MSFDIAFFILLAILILNLLVMMLYRHDKIRAKQGGRRTSERTLLIAAFIAPFGAAYGMRRYRHKTSHLKFLLVYVFMMLQLVVMAYLVYWML